MKYDTRFSQTGATLVIGMIMLVLLTLFVIAAVNMTSVNIRVMGNTQVRNEALAAGQQAIEQVASTDFPKNPQPVTVNVDINGDGTTDYVAAVAAPACTSAVPIKLTELDVASADDHACFGSIVSPTPGVSGSGGTGNSFCSNTQWDVNATVSDSASSGSAVTIHQGIARRVATGDVTC